MKALDLAISLLDAEFTKGQLNKHYREHKKEFKGLTKEQYANRAKEASEREPLKGEVKYSRKDGSKALYNLKTENLQFGIQQIILLQHTLNQSLIKSRRNKI